RRRGRHPWRCRRRTRTAVPRRSENPAARRYWPAVSPGASGHAGRWCRSRTAPSRGVSRPWAPAWAPEWSKARRCPVPPRRRPGVWGGGSCADLLSVRLELPGRGRRRHGGLRCLLGGLRGRADTAVGGSGLLAAGCGALFGRCGGCGPVAGEGEEDLVERGAAKPDVLNRYALLLEGAGDL